MGAYSFKRKIIHVLLISWTCLNIWIMYHMFHPESEDVSLLKETTAVHAELPELSPIPDPNDRRNSVYDLANSLEQYQVLLERFIVTALPDSMHRTLSEELYHALSFDVPFNDTGKVQVIHQTGKKDKKSSKVSSWTTKNPEFKRDFLDDEAADARMKAILGSSPLWEIYNRYEKFIMKADFLRYAFMYFEGGVYSDMDTSCLKPISKWGKMLRDSGADLNVMLGIEIEAWDREDWYDWYARPIQIIQWTLVSFRPHHPIFLDAMRRMFVNSKSAFDWENLRAEKVEDLIAQGSTDEAERVLNLPNPIQSVMELTGPGLFSDAVMSYLKVKHNVDWKDLRQLLTPRQVGDVSLLPITSFSPGTKVGSSGPITHRLAYVHHAFEGSWKEDLNTTTSSLSS